MSAPVDILQKILHRLQSRAELSAADCAAVLRLPYTKRVYEPPAYIVREGEPTKKHCSFVLSGFAFRQKLTVTGARQILSIHMAGDFLDLQHLFLHRADHSVQALNRLESADIPRAALQTLCTEHPAIGRAMWIEALIEASIFREWVVNVARRDARSRVAHLLCEFAMRMESAGIADQYGYVLPMTQEQLGDATGLTSVHINRTLKVLAEEGLIQRDKRHIRFDDWERLRRVGDFSALYLHNDQLPHAPPGRPELRLVPSSGLVPPDNNSAAANSTPGSRE